ncbi:phBC6A51 family helix-turn-helix protein, partial [Bartonella sp. CL29QHWL]|uniref:phBC6A51 family helix-turn-helix protein n=1 Tax=Bartonella sp. CL29QHWL TaxID=3243522 RepID=UPI0035CEF06E
MQITQYGDDDGLSPEQRIAAEIIATPGRAGMTLEQISEHVGTTARTLNRWRQQPAFIAYVKKRTMENTVEHLPDVMDTLVRKAKEGSSIKSIEVYLRATGLLNPDVT